MKLWTSDTNSFIALFVVSIDDKSVFMLSKIDFIWIETLYVEQSEIIKDKDRKGLLDLCTCSCKSAKTE